MLVRSRIIRVLHISTGCMLALGKKGNHMQIVSSCGARSTELRTCSPAQLPGIALLVV